MTSGAEISISFQSPYLSVSASGMAHILCDIGAQLSWLGAACAASDHPTKMALRSVKIVSKSKKPKTACLTIRYQSRPVESESCWHGLFKNPVIAVGFQTLSRKNEEQGLDISLDLMTSLGLCDRITVFDGRLVIKGFSSMFIPTKLAKNSIQWHFIYHEDGSRVSYLEGDKYVPVALGPAELTVPRLEASRHFVGWASSVLVQVGRNAFLRRFCQLLTS
jgi:hypothetical protein